MSADHPAQPGDPRGRAPVQQHHNAFQLTHTPARKLRSFKYGVHMQIILLNLVVHAGVHLSSSITAAYQIVRVLRLLRFFSLLRRLYSTALATSSFVLPGVSVSLLA